MPRSRGWLRRVLGIAGMLAQMAASTAAVETFPLQPGIPVERSLAEGESHAYEVDLRVGSSWRLHLTVGGHRAEVRVVGPDGVERLRAHTLFGLGWAESLVFTTERPGRHRVELRSARGDAAVGPYALQVEEMLTLSGLDRLRADLERARSRAAELRLSGSAPERREAEERLHQTLEPWRELGEQREELRTLFYLAELAADRADSDSAHEYLEEARRWAEAMGEPRLEALALDRLGFTALRRGRFAEAESTLEQAIEVWREQGEMRGEVHSRSSLCTVFLRRGAWPGAETCYLAALEKVRGLSEPGLEARLLSSLGGVHANLGEPDAAIENYRRSLELDRALGNVLGEAQTRNNLGSLHRRLGEIDEALAHYRSALETFRALDDVYWLARTLNNLGYAYLSLGDAERAAAFLGEALPLRRRVGDRSGEAVTLRNLGRAALAGGDLQEAQDHFAAALALSAELGDRRGEAAARELLGTSLERLGKLAEARAELERALEIRRELDHRQGEAAVLKARGDVLLQGGETAAALESFSEALEIFREGRDLAGQAEAHEGLARAEYRAQRRDRALQHLGAGLGIVESLRTHIPDPGQRAEFLASRRGLYELSIGLWMARHAEEPTAGHDRAAFEISEHAHGRSLVDSRVDTAAAWVTERDPELRDRLRSVRRRLDAKSQLEMRLLARGLDAEATSRQVQVALAELEAVRAEIRRRSPGYAELDAPEPLTTGDIQDLLDPETALFHYSLGEERSFLWVLTRDGFKSFELPGQETLERLALAAHRELTRLDLRTRQTSRRSAIELSRKILEPAAHLLSKPRLAVVPDGALHYVPFATLPTPGGGAPLVETHEVVHLASASALAASRRVRASRPPARGAVAILADPIFDRSYERLPHTRDEALAIARLFPPEATHLALGLDANREALAQAADYRVIHFATHGLLHPQNPELSGLVLSPVDGSGGAEAGFLSLHDVLGRELGAELVVLSGCQTALGEEIRGEGFVGLAWGFLYAGVPRVVASHWQVQDRATTELMTRFYRALLIDHHPPAAALREAQLALAHDRRWRDPFYWGAFVFEGDWAPLEEGRE